MGMIRKAAEVRLTPEDRAVLEARVRAPTSEQREVFRARIVLLAGEGRSTRSVAGELGTMPRTVSTWRGRYARQGLAGLADKPRPGPKPKYDAETGRRILAVLEDAPPATHKKNGAWLAAHPNVHFHFTPTRALAQSGRDLVLHPCWQGAHRRLVHLRHPTQGAYRCLHRSYNANATPFVWTKAQVHQRRFKNRRVSQL